MPGAADHKLAAERFLRQYEDLPEDRIEFRILALFYCAVHVVEMVRYHQEKRDSRGHKDRDHWLETNHRSKCWKHYWPLLDLSKGARYDAYPDPTDLISAKDVHETARLKYLDSVLKWAREIMGAQGEIPESIPAKRPAPPALPAAVEPVIAKVPTPLA